MKEIEIRQFESRNFLTEIADKYLLWISVIVLFYD